MSGEDGPRSRKEPAAEAEEEAEKRRWRRLIEVVNEEVEVENEKLKASSSSTSIEAIKESRNSTASRSPLRLILLQRRAEISATSEKRLELGFKGDLFSETRGRGEDDEESRKAIDLSQPSSLFRLSSSRPLVLSPYPPLLPLLRRSWRGSAAGHRQRGGAPFSGGGRVKGKTEPGEEGSLHVGSKKKQSSPLSFAGDEK